MASVEDNLKFSEEKNHLSNSVQQVLMFLVPSAG